VHSNRREYNPRVELEILQIDGGHAIASYGPVLIRVITTAPTDAALLDELRRLTESALERWPMIGIWVVVHHGAPFPDGEVRRHVERDLRPLRDRLCMVVSLLGLGFWAVTAVSVSSMLAKLIGQPALTETSVENGANRLGRELIGVDAEKLAVIHDELLDRIRNYRAE
jgi:hypothetical protein